MTDSNKFLGEAPIGRAFVRLAAPAVLAQLINIAYNLVDKMYVGISLMLELMRLQVWVLQPL